MSSSNSTATSLGRATRIGALALLVGIALSADLAKLMELLELPPGNVGEMAQRDQRFELLRTALPRRASLGYVSDVSNEADLEMRIMLAQFSLAPTLLVLGSDRVPVLGDFSNPNSIGLGRELKLSVLHDFGDGVVLFGRAER